EQGEQAPVVGLVDELRTLQLGGRRDRLLERAHRLPPGRLEGAFDRHHLPGRSHLRAEPPIAGRELVERPARNLDDAVVERRLERGERAAGYLVANLLEPP